MTPSLAYSSALTEIEAHLIELRRHLDFAKAHDFCPANLARLEAAMAKTGMCARRIYAVALDAQVECGIAEEGE